ncbi:MAG: SH3 domain-containing protein [Litoreibacter sp.]
MLFSKLSCLGFLLFLPCSVQASLGCFVETDNPDASSVNLYETPDLAALVLREVPLGDAVQYPDQNDAPTQSEGWIWVRHEITQEAMWPAGIEGWMKSENLSC